MPNGGALADDEPSSPDLRREQVPIDVFDFAPPKDNVVDIGTAVRGDRRKPEPLRVRVGPSEDTMEAGEAGESPEAGDRPYAGRYRIEEDLPAAPGTRRHLAVQEPAVRRVVLSVLETTRARDAQQALEARFLRDARVLARLRHPCLAPVHDAGRAADGTCFFTEEAPFGPTFADLARSKSLPTERLLALAANIVSALATMHEAGVVHRCVRADTVVVGPGVWRGTVGTDVAQLGRFGLHVLPEEVAADPDVENAVVWPPEVLAGQEPDEAADIYAVGVLLHLALTGKPVYGGTAPEIRAATMKAMSPRLPRPGERVADRLCEVAERCLAPSPDARYPSARALLRELEELARAPVVVPTPVPPAGLSFWGVVAAAFAGAAVPTVLLLAFAGLRGAVSPSAPVAPTSAPTPVVAEAPPKPVAEVVAPAPAPVEIAPVPPVTEPAPAPRVAETAPVAMPAPVPVAPQAAAPRNRTWERPAAPAVAAPAPASPPEPVAVTPPPEPPKVEPEPVAPVAVVEAPAPVREAPAAAAAPTVPGAEALTGLWLGKAPGGALALDLVVSPDGKVTGRARRADHPGEGVIVGRVSAAEGGLRLELQISDATGAESYSGTVADGAISGRITAGGKSAGKFSARK